MGLLEKLLPFGFDISNFILAVCARDLDHYLRGWTKGRKRFQCEDNGNYKSVQCLDDNTCFCADKFGRRLLGSKVVSEKQKDYELNC